MPVVKKIKKEGRVKLSIAQQKRQMLALLPAEMRANFGKTATAGGVAAAIGNLSDVYLLAFDFVPIPPSPTSSQVGMQGYDINWPGPPRHPLDWSDVRFYKPQISIRNPAPLDLLFCFWVYEDVTAWFDTLLASFCATIKQGNRTPVDSDIVCLSSIGGDAPLHAPHKSTGAFWLGATEEGNIKGNEGENGRTADVYLAAFDIVGFPDGSSSRYDRAHDESHRHTIHTR
jgi:hypothetical protein